MSVAEAFAHFDATTMFDNTMNRIRRVAGVRALPSTTNVQDYLEANGLGGRALSKTQMPDLDLVANDTKTKTGYNGGTLTRRRARRERRADRAA